MSNFSNKRILGDLKIIKKNQLDKHNIYVSINDDNIYNIKALIIGPGDTPYEGGYYFFDFEIPKKYPWEPPKATFKTLNNKVRFNPNLYKNGKVCVSILNTWDGPGWTSVCTLSGVLLSIQSLLNENPIHNEPGWEKENGEKCKNYNEMISFYNLKVGVLDILNNIPCGFEVFKDIINQYFIKNFTKYQTFIEKRMKHDGKILNLRLYNMSTELNYLSVLEELTILYSKLIDLY
tara:strand:- start:3919 stop:4620 length:702 start_codon:yes stop_codon:yes gene_type:complete